MIQWPCNGKRKLCMLFTQFRFLFDAGKLFSPGNSCAIMTDFVNYIFGIEKVSHRCLTHKRNPKNNKIKHVDLEGANTRES